MKKTILLLTGLTLALYAISQTPGVKWTRYIRTSNDGEVFYDIKGTPDHGYIAVGADSVNPSQYGRDLMYNKAARANAWIVKLDTSGNMTWRRDNRATANQSAFTSVVLSGDGGYVAAGYNRPSGDSSQYYISKFDASGTALWQKSYGASMNEYAYSIAKTSSGGFIVAGVTYSTNGYVVGNHGPTHVAEAWLIKLKANGDTVWTRCYGGSSRDTAYSVIETSDKGFVVAGSSRSSDGNLTGNNGESDGWIFKIDSSGNLLWQQNFGGAGEDGFRNVVENADGSFTAAGYTFSTTATSNGNKGMADFWVARINSNGSSTVWSKGFGGPASDMAVSIVRTQDEGYFVTGSTQSNANDVSGNSGLVDAWAIKVTGSGNLAWQRCVGTAKEEFGLAAVYQSESLLTIAGSAQPVSALEPGDGYLARLGNTNQIKGLLYLDLNSNGIRDIGEPPFNQANVVSFKSGFARTTNPVNGIFQLDVESGTYTTQPVLHYPYYTVVPASRVSNFPGTFSRDSFSFAIRPITSRQDMNIQAIATTVARPGFVVNYRINYKNAGTLVMPNATILFKKDSRLSLQSSNPAVSSTSGDTLKWDLTNFQPQSSGIITLSFLVPAPPLVNIGNYLSSKAIIEPVSGDLTPRDDTAILRQLVQGSYDPNDKAENLGGTITTQQVASADFINYIIRFQNTGTDTAFTVVVRDTLDTKLNQGKVEMIEASHPYQFQIVAPNVLSWTFTDINLPDSNINEPASHGFITYRVKPVTTLVQGDTIFNNAGIYFDYNLPEFTNEAATVVQDLVLLPGRLTSFSASYQKPDALLEWKTVEEQNVGKFEIQRSNDMVHFATIGSVKAKGDLSGGSEYDFRDALANIGGEKFYYRLRILDLDEKVNYSRVVMINRNGQSGNEVILNPNPVRGGKAIAWVWFNKDAAADIRVIDMQGRSILSTQQKISKGYNVVPLDLSTINNGTYFLQVRVEGKQMVTPFVIAQ
jgi:uncharacterized repeat protein (TIGR01451 family)